MKFCVLKLYVKAFQASFAEAKQIDYVLKNTLLLTSLHINIRVSLDY